MLEEMLSNKDGPHFILRMHIARANIQVKRQSNGCFVRRGIYIRLSKAFGLKYVDVLNADSLLHCLSLCLSVCMGIHEP